MIQLMNLFFKKPNKEYHVRGIAKTFKISPTTASKYLKELEKKEIIKSEQKYSHLIFKASTESENYRIIKRNHNILQLYESGLITFLKKKYNEPQTIILFGSYSKAEDTEESDIDLLIITPLKKQLNLEKFEKTLGRTIQIFEISNKDFKKTNVNLKTSWINGTILEGHIEL